MNKTRKKTKLSNLILALVSVQCTFAVNAKENVQNEDSDVLELPVVEIVGEADSIKRLPGTVNVLKQEELFESHVYNINEALRKVPGVNVRDEEGFGMRPNIGIRGINPSRSTKTLLLEDGIPLSYAPYGDNASYYHPPVERFSSIEILKGPSQILYGPQTISGTINYLTPNPPSKPGGFLSFTGGTRDYYNGHFNYGGTVDNFGGLLDIVHKESEGARDNTHSDINDFNVKGVYDIDANNAITLRANYFQEDSQLTYSGITDAEANNFGLQYNPFKNDNMKTDRYGTSLTHQLSFNDDIMLTTNVYWSHFHRDWWRQASTTTDSQCGEDFRNTRLAGGKVDPDACDSIQGRLRDYSYGVEPRLHVNHQTFGIDNEFDIGFRAHFEEQFRTQANSQFLGETTEISENNERGTDAYSGYAQNKFIFGDWSLTPGVRIEHMDFSRSNLLTGARGNISLTEVLPAFGATYSPNDQITAFFGFHGGFAPPRVEDSISNSGTLIDVGPEKSWNYEVGVRTKPYTGAKLDATLFHADFQQQNAVGSIAGGSTPLAAGEALYEGAELFARQDFGPLFNTEHNIYFQAAYTWVATAEMTSAFQCLGSFSDCDGVTARGLANGDFIGNRLPYAPEHNLTATIGYSHPSGFDIHLETVYVGKQYGDFMNLKTGADHPDGPTSNAARSGQFGQIDDYVVLNVGTTYHAKPLNTDFFVTLKNLLDETYIVDRTRGILPGSPRLVQAGFKVNF